MHLFGFVVRIYHDARSPERQKLVIPFQGPSSAWMKNCFFFFQGFCCVRRVDEFAGEGEGASCVMKWVCSQTHEASGRMKNNFLPFVSVSINLHDWISINAFAKLRKSLLASLCLSSRRSVCLSVCLSLRPHWTTGLPLDGCLLQLIFGYFSKICRENSSPFKIWQE